MLAMQRLHDWKSGAIVSNVTRHVVIWSESPATRDDETLVLSDETLCSCLDVTSDDVNSLFGE